MKVWKKILSQVLCMAMIIPSVCGFAVYAESANGGKTIAQAETVSLTNYYELQGSGIPTGTANADFDPTAGYVSSHLVSVTAGDVITFGLVDLSQG